MFPGTHAATAPERPAVIIATTPRRPRSQGILARFKAPRSVDFIDELPRSATGKLVKRKLQDRYLEAHA